MLTRKEIKKGDIIVDTMQLYEGTELKVKEITSSLVIAEIIKSKGYAPFKNYIARFTKKSFKNRFKKKVIKNSIQKIGGN